MTAVGAQALHRIIPMCWKILGHMLSNRVSQSDFESFYTPASGSID